MIFSDTRAERRLGTIPWEDYSPKSYSEGDILAAGNIRQAYDIKAIVKILSRMLRGHPPIAAVVAHQVPMAHSPKAKVTPIIWSTSPVAEWESILEDGAEPDNVGKTEAKVFPMRSIA